jgi:hypothetical protein
MYLHALALNDTKCSSHNSLAFGIIAAQNLAIRPLLTFSMHKHIALSTHIVQDPMQCSIIILYRPPTSR